MKECNIPFCKEIPDTWKEVPNKYLFEYHSVKVGDKWKNYQLLSLTTGGVKEKDINASGGKVPDSYDKYQTVEPGDMIFCLFDLDVSAVFSGLSHHYGMITSAYEVVRPNHKILDQYFSDFWFQYVFANRYYKMYSKNIRFTIGSDMFKAICTPIPPMNQQRKIAGFLNKKTAEIYSLIEIENQQIEKLKEYKQAVITETITKGLDKTVQMKDSGIDWIGDIPLNWSIQRFKNFGECRNGLTYSPTDICSKEEGILVLRSSNIQNNKLVFDDNVYVNCSIKDELFVRRNDILICSRNGSANLIGKNVLIPGDLYASFGAFMMIYRCCDPIYLRYILCSNIFFQYLGTFLTVSVNQLTGSNFMNISFPYPKEKNERLKIINYLDEKCAEIDALIAIKQKKIDDLNEYKKSLIYEYVTGKKEVC